MIIDSNVAGSLSSWDCWIHSDSFCRSFDILLLPVYIQKIDRSFVFSGMFLCVCVFNICNFFSFSNYKQKFFPIFFWILDLVVLVSTAAATTTIIIIKVSLLSSCCFFCVQFFPINSLIRFQSVDRFIHHTLVHLDYCFDCPNYFFSEKFFFLIKTCVCVCFIDQKSPSPFFHCFSMDKTIRIIYICIGIIFLINNCHTWNFGSNDPKSSSSSFFSLVSFVCFSFLNLYWFFFWIFNNNNNNESWISRPLLLLLKQMSICVKCRHLVMIYLSIHSTKKKK